jgi:uncharacterized protein (TIGR00251 family)
MSFLSSFEGGVRLTVKAKPNSKHAREWQVVDIGEGKQALEIAVASKAEGGKANQEICQQIAKKLGLSKAEVLLKAGQTGRIKIVEIHGVNEADIKKAAAL